MLERIQSRNQIGNPGLRGKDMIGIKEPDGLDWADKFYWAAGSYFVSIGLTSLVLEVFGLCYLGTFQAMTVIMGGIGFMVITAIGRINPTFPIWLLEWRHSSLKWHPTPRFPLQATDSGPEQLVHAWTTVHIRFIFTYFGAPRTCFSC